MPRMRRQSSWHAEDRTEDEISAVDDGDEDAFCKIIEAEQDHDDGCSADSERDDDQAMTGFSFL